MADTTREELLAALAELGKLFPDWRMGQTLANLAMAAGRAESGAVWDLEDYESRGATRRLIEGNSQLNPEALLDSSLYVAAKSVDPILLMFHSFYHTQGYLPLLKVNNGT